MDTIDVIDHVSYRLKRITREQRNIRVGKRVPTISEILSLLPHLDTPIESFEGEKLYYLGQLVMILDILAEQDKGSMLVRWFD
jgi:hypothetical protein